MLALSGNSLFMGYRYFGWDLLHPAGLWMLLLFLPINTYRT